MISADDAPLLVVFAAVVRCGSFSAAALSLKLSKSVVSERVKQLEARCGVRLLERTTRKLSLTEAGSAVLSAATAVQDTLGTLSRSLDAARAEPTGTLRVSTTNDLAATLVAPVVARMVAAWSGVRVEVLAADHAHDVLAAGIDLAVRLGAPKNSSFVVRRLCVLEEPIVAAPTLADALGEVVRPRDLAGAPWVRHALLASGPMKFQGPGSAVEELAPRVRAEADSGVTLLALLLQGAGVGVLPMHVLQEHLLAGRLVRLCPGWHWKKVSLYALTPSGASQRPAQKVFLTMLREQVARDALRFAAAE